MGGRFGADPFMTRTLQGSRRPLYRARKLPAASSMVATSTFVSLSAPRWDTRGQASVKGGSFASQWPAGLAISALAATLQSTSPKHVK